MVEKGAERACLGPDSREMPAAAIVVRSSEEVTGLSGGNILTFLSLCQFIWDTQNQVKEEGEALNRSE